jgi:hypothetical protein
MTDPKDRIEHTLEVLVYAPIGVGLYLKDMGPTFVNMFVARGRAEIDRRQAQVQQRTTTARSIGQVAVTFGVPMVRQRVEKEVDSARQRAQSFLGTIGGTDTGPAAAPAPAPRPRAAAAPAAPAGTGATTHANGSGAPAADDASGSSAANGSSPDPGLPIPGYDALSASQVVQRLNGLAPEELDAVRDYETAHRRRRTILGKIDQISA